MNEEALVAALEKLGKCPSDADAWENLYRLVWPLVVGKMYRLLGVNSFLAEEAMQEVMLRLVRYMDFSSISLTAKGFLSYLNSVCKSVMFDLLRRERQYRKVAEFSDKNDDRPLDEMADWQLTPEEKAVPEMCSQGLWRI